jgi:hypothetical protein
MRHLKHLPILMLMLLIAISLSACLMQPPGGGLPVSATADKIRTQAVGTALAQLTLQALSAGGVAETPSAAPSPTPEPSDTPAPPTTVPTATPKAGPTSTASTSAAVYNPPTFTVTPAQTDYVCSVEEIEPAAGTTVKVGADFDFVVRLKNTGAKDWLPGKILFAYTSGQSMQTKAGLVPLTSRVPVDDTVNFTLDMRAPDAPGTYRTTWALLQPPLYFCPVHFQIVVTR